MFPTTAPAPGADTAVHTMTLPAALVCLDIETGNADEKLVAEEVERWEPPSNVKDPEKIEARRQEFAAKTREKSALLDGSPIVCVAARTEKEGRIFNGINKKSYSVNHSQVVSSGNEEKMLLALREWLDTVAGEATVIVGFNLISFDLPRLRGAYMRHRLKLPRVLTPRILENERQPAVDVMRLFLKWFTAEYHDERMISLDEVIRRLGMPRYKDRIDGSQVPAFVDQGKVREVLTYCAVDTMATMQAYLLMTSAAAEMK